MRHQKLSQTKKAIASPQSQSHAIAQHSPHPIEELQSALGNRAVNRLLANQPVLQAKPMFKGLSGELRSPTPLQAKPAKEADSASVSEVQPENKTGLPDRLKAGIENYSGLAMDDVRVHYNSSKPSELQALAYTQGTDIHVAPGQETHLPHEAWHVVQQKQGRVKPTIQAKGIGINDDEGLEKEADVMGTKAAQGEQVRVAGLGQGVQRKTADNVGDVVQCGGWRNLTYKIGRNTGLSLGTAGGKQGAKDRKAHRSTRNPPQTINLNNNKPNGYSFVELWNMNEGARVLKSLDSSRYAEFNKSKPINEGKTDKWETNESPYVMQFSPILTCGVVIFIYGSLEKPTKIAVYHATGSSISESQIEKDADFIIMISASLAEGVAKNDETDLRKPFKNLGIDDKLRVLAGESIYAVTSDGRVGNGYLL